MQEKDIVNDVLMMTKASMSEYEKAIGESSNQELRGTLQQLRNEAEQFQFDLSSRAEQLEYYTPAQDANSQDRQQIKSQLSQGGNNNQGMNLK